MVPSNSSEQRVGKRFLTRIKNCIKSFRQRNDAVQTFEPGLSFSAVAIKFVNYIGLMNLRSISAA